MTNTTNLFSLEGKNALITGGAYGIGFEIAKAFVEAGAKTIIFNNRNEKTLRLGLDNYKQAGIDNVKGYLCDVTDEKQVAAMFAARNLLSPSLTSLTADSSPAGKAA